MRPTTMFETKHVFFFFLDGVGLGEIDPNRNPFGRAKLAGLKDLLGGKPLVASSAPYVGARATLLALDAGLGVPGLPQSATGQAALLSGKNAPALIGEHYGPKPNQAIAELVTKHNLFKTLKMAELQVAFLNAFPPAYFEAIGSGRRLNGTIALAATRAGVPLRTLEDLQNGQAISADLSGAGLRTRLKLADAPVISYEQAGRRMARLARVYDFTLFEYWLTDYAGHGQEMEAACRLLEDFDQALQALVTQWDDETGLIVLTSDHGNLEDLSTRRHTSNAVPCLLIGSPENRQNFSTSLKDLTDIAPAIYRFFGLADSE